MATVYLAQDLRHDRHVALKVLRPDLAAAIGAERFLREIDDHGEAAASAHPAAATIPARRTGLLYYVMPFVEGESLRERLDRERSFRSTRRCASRATSPTP